MTSIFSFLFGLITFFILLIVYKMIISPKIRLAGYKSKYGDKVKTFYRFGEVILQKYHESLKKYNDSMVFIRQLHDEKLKAICFNFGTGVGISFVDSELIKEVHQNPEAFYKLDASMAITHLFGDSLLYASGKNWQRQRQFLGKSFHFEEIKNYLPSIKQLCTKTFGSVSEKLKTTDQQEIKVVTICEEVTSELVFNVFFGSSSDNIVITKKDGSTIPVAHELVDVIMKSLDLLQTDKIALIKWLFWKRNSSNYFPTKGETELKNRLIALKDTCQSITDKRRDELINRNAEYKNNFLDQYLKEMIVNKNTSITDEEIVSNFLGLFFAGTDTTGNMTGAALYYLSIYPHVQELARQEVLKVLSAKTQSKNPEELFSSLAFEDLSHLNFINSVLKESLRLMPPAVEVFPRIAKQDMKIGEFDVKKGDFVNTNFMYNQTNASIYTNPETFDPQRWMNGKDNVFNFTPFSMGPRNCIGQHLAMIEGKCMLAYILLNFEIIPNKNVEIVKEMKIIYCFQQDNLVYFKKRNTTTDNVNK